MPVSHYNNQPSLPGQQQFYQPQQQQQQQMHQPPNHPFDSQINQYNNQQPQQQQYHPQAAEPNPGVIQLRHEVPSNQAPAPIIVSQPAAKRFRGSLVY